MFKNLLQYRPQIKSLREALLGMTILGWTLASVNPAQAAIFGLKSADNGDGTLPTHLFSFEEDGIGGAVDLGEVTIGGTTPINADALAIDKNDNLFAFQLTGVGTQNIDSRLLSLNSTNGTATAIGSVLAGRDIRGAAFDFNNKLLAIDSANDELLTIDVNTGNVINSIGLQLNGIGFDMNNATDIAIRNDGVNNNQIFSTVFVNRSRDIYSLDVLTGELNFVHNVGNDASMRGLAFSDQGQPQDLYAFDGILADDIFKFDTNDDPFTRELLIEDILPEFNSGRGDLAARVKVEIPEPSGVGAILAFGVGFFWRGWRDKNK